MRLVSSSVVLALVLAVLAGCKEDETGKPSSPQKEKASATPLKDRLEAALAVQDGTTRDATLVQLAEDAAAAGDAEVTKSALKRIDVGTSRDGAAQKCALKLADLGKGAEAVEVAKTIDDGTTRDAILAKIAKAKG